MTPPVSALSVLSALCSRPCFDLRLRLGHLAMPKWRQIRFKVVDPTPRSFAASFRCLLKCCDSILRVIPHGGSSGPCSSVFHCPGALEGW